MGLPPRRDKMKSGSAYSTVGDSVSSPLASRNPSVTTSEDQKQVRSVKPPLKWAGGKRWLVPYLSPIWREHQNRNYVEPFCGGLAAALGLKPGKALLNDLNPHLVNFYRQVQRGLKVTIEMRYDEALFYSHRRRFNELIREQKHETPEAAQLFYYLNRTCFNGLCRFNQSGEFNVPFGSYKTVGYVSDFYTLRALFQKWLFTTGDLSAIPLEPGDFIYADPPYDVEFTSYTSGGFSWEDQVRTTELLATHPGPVILSNQSTPRIEKLYQQLGFTIHYLAAPRRISSTGDRSAAQEVLAVKNL